MERNYDAEIAKFVGELEDEILNVLGMEEINNEEKESTKEIVVNQLKEQVKKLRELAELKDAMFSFNEEEDKFIKDHIKSYMMWFKGVAYKIEETAKTIEENIE